MKIIVKDMHCINCVKRIQTALSNESIEASVNLEDKSIVYQDENATKKILAAIEELGFSGKLKK